MDGFSLETQRCPDGVELVDKWFCYRTDRRAALRLELSNLEDPVSIAYVNARSDDARAKFFSQFSLLDRVRKLEQVDTRVLRADVVTGQKQIRTMLAIAGGGDTAKAIKEANFVMASHQLWKPLPALDLAGNDGAPRMVWQIQSLMGLMIMEVAMVIVHRARFATCNHCEAAFLTGALTWRRSHARFCSDKCRVAAMRERQRRSTNG